MTDKPIAHTADGRPLFDNTPTVVAVVATIHPDLMVVIRRANEPGKCLLGLPGGYQMRGESWQEAGAREFHEETGMRIVPNSLKLLSLDTDEYGNNLIIAEAMRFARGKVKIDPNEVEEVLFMSEPGGPSEWAFPRHHSAAMDYWFR